MSTRDQALLDEVAALLADEAHREQPLYDALERLYRHHLEQRDRLERLIGIADGFQESAQRDLLETRQQLERQRRRQRKLSRIADRFQDLLHERNQALEDVSSQDPLTGLANRRRLHQQLEEMADAAGFPLSVAMVDIDHFKAINDRHGHAAGDRVLVALAQTLESSLREGDVCGRWGGEEFLLILPRTRLDQAERLVARLGERLRRLGPMPSGVPDGAATVTASIGIAEHRADETFRDTIHRADQALLAAKREGRDRTRRAG